MSNLRPGTLLVLPSLAAIGLLAAPGCGDTSGIGKTLPVAGKVTLDDTPLTAPSTVLLFKPDASRGNTSLWEPTGTVDDQGNYVLFTNGKKGAPPGWYKVLVTASAVQTDGSSGSPHKRPVPRSLVPARYGQAATTPVTIEVVEAPTPEAYDLKLTSP
jgi:hypothetical protein